MKPAFNKIVKPPSVAQTYREERNDYVFNSKGFYSDLQEQLDEQYTQVSQIYSRLQRKLSDN